MNFLFPLLNAAASTYDPENYNIGLVDGLIVAFGGYAMVFAGLIALMVVVIIVGKLFAGKKASKKAEAPAAAAEEAAPAAEAAPQVAPGTAGQLKLYDVSPKTAAMLMAIVADKMGKPLNELRFISIKEVK